MASFDHATTPGMKRLPVEIHAADKADPFLKGLVTLQHASEGLILALLQAARDGKQVRQISGGFTPSCQMRQRHSSSSPIRRCMSRSV